MLFLYELPRVYFNEYRVTCTGLAFYVSGLSENNNRRLHKCILKCLSLPVLENIWKKNYTKNIFRLLKSLRIEPERLFSILISVNLSKFGFLYLKPPSHTKTMKNLVPWKKSCREEQRGKS